MGMIMSIQHNHAMHRYETVIDGHVAFAEYRDAQGVRTFTHTLVPDELGGQGIGGKLARFALDDTRASGLRVIARCPFIKAWIARHPDYQDLLA